MSDTCRSCHAPIVWATTGSGKAIPVDAQPNPNGNVELIETLAIDAPPLAKVWGSSHVWAPGDVRHMAHFATCPKSPARRER